MHKTTGIIQEAEIVEVAKRNIINNLINSRREIEVQVKTRINMKNSHLTK